MDADPGDPRVDHVWRFLIDEKQPAQTRLDPPRELLRVQWEQLLRLTIPMFQGNTVRVEGFALMRDAANVIPIFVDNASSA